MRLEVALIWGENVQSLSNINKSPARDVEFAKLRLVYASKYNRSCAYIPPKGAPSSFYD